MTDFEAELIKARTAFDNLWPRTLPQPMPDSDLKRIVCEIMAYRVLQATAELRADNARLRAEIELVSK